MILTAAPKNHPQSIMDYFDLYYAYLAQCEKENWANMRDPNHDYMEWNHTLPQCIFGDQPIGQWLTIEQHAVASALQTLVFKTLCHCGWHKKHIPLLLWELASSCILHERQKWGRELGAIVGPSAGKKLFVEKKGLFDADYADLKSDWARKGIETQRREGKGLFDPLVRAALHETYVENGKRAGEDSLKNKTGLFDEKYNDLRKEWASNAGKIGGKIGGKLASERKVGIFDPANSERKREGQRKGRETANKQKWKSTLDGFVSTAAGVTSHNRSIGGSGKDKIKISEQ